MPIAVSCSQCGRKYQLRDELAGKAAKCPCGQTMTIPKAPPPVAIAVTDPPAAPVAPSDPFAGLTDDFASQGATLAPLAKTRKRPGRKRNPYLVPAIAGGAIVIVLCAVVVVVALSSGGAGTAASPKSAPPAPAAPTARWPTPESVFEAMKQAVAAEDRGAFYDTLSPRSQGDLVHNITGVLVMVQLLPEAITRARAQPLRDVIAKYGLDKVPKPSGPGGTREYTERFKAEVDRIADKREFFVVVTPIINEVEKSLNPLASGGMNQEARTQVLQTAQLADVKITSGTATGALTITFKGQTIRDSIRFTKIDGDWRIEMDVPGAQLPPGVQPPGIQPAAAAQPAGVQLPPGTQLPPGPNGPPPGFPSP
jgi:hypothetical protein